MSRKNNKQTNTMKKVKSTLNRLRKFMSELGSAASYSINR